MWLLGLLCNVLGFVVHSAALHLGSITIVQLMFGLPFAVISRVGFSVTAMARTAPSW